MRLHEDVRKRRRFQELGLLPEHVGALVDEARQRGKEHENHTQHNQDDAAPLPVGLLLRQVRRVHELHTVVLRVPRASGVPRSSF